MKKTIAVLMGGLSDEREISFLSGRACLKILKKQNLKVEEIDAKGYFVNKLKKLKPKVVFNALHGKYGEDGFVQSILESLKIPYTHSGILSSSLAMDKELSRLIFKKNNLKVPKYFILQKNGEKKVKKKMKSKKINFPIVIKPINEGSSLGVYICKNMIDFLKNYKKLNKKYEKIIIEKYIPGREIQVAVMGKQPLGAIELKPKRLFYDYKAKYNASAGTKHIIPVQIDKKNLNKVLSIALKAHKLLKCRGVTRSDFRFYNNKFYLLELNTQPGMTSLSLVPEIASYNGISFIKLIETLINDASIKK